MDPTYSPEAEAYREKVQAFLAEKLPPTGPGSGALEGDAVDEFVTEWRKTLYEANYLAPGWPVEYGGAGLSALEQVILGRGVRPRRRADRRPERRVRHPDARQHAAAVGHRGAEGALPPADPVRRGHLVPGLLRAERRLRPRQRRAARPCSTATSGCSTARRSGRRPGTSPTTSSCSPAPTPTRRSTRASRSCSSPMRPARHRGASDQDDLGRERVQRGLLHRRPLPEGRTSSAASTTAGPSR